MEISVLNSSFAVQVCLCCSQDIFHSFEYLFQIVIEFGRTNISADGISHNMHGVNESRVFYRPQDYSVPTLYSSQPTGFCAQCGVARHHLTTKFCSSCGHPFSI